ncbi:MAG: nucleotidyltransferase family protein, partial [Clostridiales bacterium]|nr:nucleotidyltransferase family protein [Clostridiales bacterium]
MRNVGIIAEYNPFHQGHLYQINKLRELGAETITVCMSGNFVQRSVPAILEKHERAATAVMSGVDLVIELPVRYSIASARDFAFGGVYLLDKTGFVDTLCFGSETDDIALITSSFSYFDKAEKEGIIKKYLNTGVSFAKARDMALLELKSPFVPRNPNDILAFEYLLAIRKLKSKICPFSVRRLGNYHDDNTVLSATGIRKKIENGTISESDLPPASFSSLSRALENGEIPAHEKFEVATLAFLKREAFYGNIDCRRFYALSEGLGNRILKYSLFSSSLSELYEKAKTKRYAMSAVRRGVVSILFGIEKKLSL